MTSSPSSVELAARLTAIQAAGRLPSVVAGVFADGELTATAAVGTGIEDGVMSAYRVGSITKTLTAVLILRLRDEGRLRLSDDVRDHVPEARFHGVRLADLLTHTSGIASEPVGPWWERHDGGDAAALLAANGEQGRVAAVGERFHYSNLGYGLLGEVVARLRGASWWQAVEEELLTPLGMTRTGYHPPARHARGHSVVHVTGELTREPHADTGAMAPAGQLWSTVADMARWTRVLTGREPDVLSRSTAAEMARDHSGAGYGWGLRITRAGERDLVGHTGSMPGFQASLFVDPVSGRGAVALANSTVGPPSDQVPALLLDGHDHRPTSDAAAERWEPSGEVPAPVLAAVGLWFWGNTALLFTWRADRLVATTLHDGAEQYTFTPLPDGTWRGLSGYHHGERLVVGTDTMECATFVYTRTPYPDGA
ncbi:serine hydrolase [Nocardioides sp. R-C-SC26]|uniref:serine hydrolase domain-containing protein n=1 Tax=Nocardioides sp. R-C-SC26 TaxID=2870414 RepID=UPI001E5EA4F9|nr:serine hydrolase domain-containing protein [Nocardioides sp. R-C-SC26]